MNNKHQQNKKIGQRFQKIWSKFQHHHRTEDYQLIDIFDIYLPFWQCKQFVIVERDVELDRFSRIILELIHNEITHHTEICRVLGIDDDSFVLMQFHFLIKNDFIQENGDKYEITYEGKQFLENKSKVKNIETIEFEYFVTERMDYLKNDLTQEFFNPNIPVDTELSDKRINDFGGYQIMQSNRIQKESIIEIPHRQKPSYREVSERRSDFSIFFNQQFSDKLFYDFADNSIETHKRNICFLGLVYQHKDQEDERILDIRHSKKSVKYFQSHDHEETLSHKTTKYLNDHPNFIE